jgi:hypothetical protein
MIGEDTVSADKTVDVVKLNLRLPKSLHQRLQRKARLRKVSLNTEIINELEGYDAAMIERFSNTSELEQATGRLHALVTGRLQPLVRRMEKLIEKKPAGDADTVPQDVDC